MTTQHSEISIRPAAMSDARQIAACVNDAYEHYIERIGQPPGPMLDDYDQVVRDREVFVAESNREIVGVLVLRETEEGFLLDNVAVHPQHTKRHRSAAPRAR